MKGLSPKAISLAQKMGIEAGFSPKDRIIIGGQEFPYWIKYADKATAQITEEEKTAFDKYLEQPSAFKDAHLAVFGDIERNTIDQMKECMKYGNVLRGVLCADAHLGYSQPVGSAIAYHDQISISGVGYDIGCGNAAARIYGVEVDEIKRNSEAIIQEVRKRIGFGRLPSSFVTEDERFAEASIDGLDFDIDEIKDLRELAMKQFASVGGGNHFIDIFEDIFGEPYIGVHFGSRGLGHTVATRFLKLANGKNGVHAKPVLVDLKSELAEKYAIAHDTCVKYAERSRMYVMFEVKNAIESVLTGKYIPVGLSDFVSNNHNFFRRERVMVKGEMVTAIVVRKGCTPIDASSAFGKESFIGGSMGTASFIIGPDENVNAHPVMNSTIHGAGRVMGRRVAKENINFDEAKKLFPNVIVSGGDADEAPQAYKDILEVLDHHTSFQSVKNTLKPMIVFMAEKDNDDQYKD